MVITNLDHYLGWGSFPGGGGGGGGRGRREGDSEFTSFRGHFYELKSPFLSSRYSFGFVKFSKFLFFVGLGIPFGSGMGGGGVVNSRCRD